MHTTQILGVVFITTGLLLGACANDDTPTSPAQQTPTTPFPDLTGTSSTGKRWVIDSVRYSASLPWQLPTSSCYDDDPYTYRPDTVFSRETGSIVGECSGCTNCYYTGTWQYTPADSLLVHIRPNGGARDSFRVYTLTSTRLVYTEWSTVYDFWFMYRPLP
jgi:hypothetical protein